MSGPDGEAVATASGLRARGLRKRHRRRTGWFRSAEEVQALDGVDLDVLPSKTVALLGPSGAGKSTLARCLAGVESPDAGEVWLDGTDRLSGSQRTRRQQRHRIQLLFQDVGTALNPRLTILESLSEPLRLRGEQGAMLRARTYALLEEVGLPQSLGDRRPREISGGQRQRVAIARALAAGPSVMILDEALAGLDLSVQAKILNLLRRVQTARSLACLYITHDSELMTEVAEEIVVLRAGRIVDRHG